MKKVQPARLARDGTKFNPAIHLAELFLDSEHGADLTVCLYYHDGAQYKDSTEGKWHTFQKTEGGTTLFCSGIELVEVKARILQFLTDCEAEVSSRLISEIEKLSRCLIPNRERGRICKKVVNIGCFADSFRTAERAR